MLSFDCLELVHGFYKLCCYLHKQLLQIVLGEEHFSCTQNKFKVSLGQIDSLFIVTVHAMLLLERKIEERSERCSVLYILLKIDKLFA